MQLITLSLKLKQEQMEKQFSAFGTLLALMEERARSSIKGRGKRTAKRERVGRAE